MPDSPPGLMTLFTEALALSDPAERAAYLDRACAGDAASRRRVDELLAAHPGVGRFLEPDATAASVPDPQSVARAGDPDATRPGESAPPDPDGTAAYEERDETADDRPGAVRRASGGGAAVGQVIAGRYTLTEVIGEGGMGSVYLASQTEPVRRRVAVKLIKAGMDSRAVLARFDAERQALAVMDHPNIARIYDGGVTELGQPYFVMELVKGVPLTEYCDTGRLTVDARLQLFVAVCSAVQHAHQKGIIHRDLKPGNVLVTEVDGRPTPKVIDFGVAKATEQKLTEMSFSDVGAVVGTPAYMSPEQADPTAMDIDTRTDVYALGVMLYELLTGSPPIDSRQFKRGALLEILRMVREVEPPRPSTKLTTADALPNIAANRSIEPAQLARLLQGELDWVVMRALEKDRTRRYESANGLAQDLQRYLADEVVEARPPSRGYRLRKFVKRNKAQVVAVSLVLLALIGGVIGTSVGMVRAENAREAEVTQRGLAEQLATRNGQLAEEEKAAKEQARELAEQNGQLALSETQARKDREAQLDRTKATLFTSQMERVGAVLEKDPTAAVELLNDTEACPPALRDVAWAFAEKAAKRREYASFPVPAGPYQAISPDGKWLAVADVVRAPGRRPTSQVTVIEVATGGARATLPPFADSVELLAFTPDGTRLAVVADGPLRRMAALAPGERPAPSVVPGKVQLWDVAGAKIVTTFEGHTDRIAALAFSADGTRLVTGSLDKTARLWDVKSGRSEHTFEGHTLEVSAVALRPDGKRLATGGLDNVIKVWDVDARRLLDTWTPAANPDPELAAHRNEAGRMGNPSQGPMFVFGRLTDAVTGLDFSADGTALVSSNSNCQLEVRDAATGQVRTTVRDLKHPLWWVRFHRDGKSVLGYQRLTLTTQQQTPAVNRWDVSTGQLVFTLPVPVTNTASAAFCKDQGLLAITAGARCVVHDLDAAPERAAFATPKATGETAVPTFSRAGDLLAVGFGPLIYVWDVRTGALRHTLKGHVNHVQALAVSPDGNVLASSARSPLDPEGKRPKDDIHLWDLTSGQLAGKLPLGAETVPSVAFSQDGGTLAAVHVDAFEFGNPKAVVSVWNVKGRAKLFAKDHPDIGFAGYAHDGAAVAFNPADGSLVSAAGHSLCVWDVATRAPRRTVRTGRSNIPDPSSLNEFIGLAIRPDGKSAVTVNQTGGFNTTVFDLNEWDLSTGELVRKVRNFGGRRIGFTADGRSLVTAASHKLEVWDTLTLQRRGSFPAHGVGGQAAAAVSPDGQTLATATIPTSNLLGFGVPVAAEVKLWDVSRSAAVMAFAGRSDAGLSFSPDSKVLVESDRLQGRTRFWDLATGRLLSTADTTQQTLDGVLSPDGRYLAGADVGGPAADKFASKLRHPETNLLKLTALLTLWDTTANAGRQFEVGKGVIVSHRFSPDGSRLALVLDTSVGDGTVLNASLSALIWNIAEGKVEAAYPFKNVSGGGGPAFRPDGRVLAIPVVEGVVPTHKLKVLLVDVRKGESLPAIDLNARDTLVRTVRFTPEGTRLVVRRGAETGERTLWDVGTGTRVDEPIPDVFGPANLSADGRYELKASPAGVEVIDRTLVPPPVVSHRRRP